MERALKEAIEANNLPKIREALVDIILHDSGKTIPIETVTEVIETTPGIFDADNGKVYGNPRAMTDNDIKQLVEDLKSNFSHEKFGLLTELFANKALKSEKYIYKPVDVVVEEVAYVAPEEEEKKPVSREEREQMLEDAKEAFGADTPRKRSCGKKAGAVIMALGCAAAIVGLCVPVKFLLGLGIGIFMLGTAVIYMNISRS